MQPESGFSLLEMMVVLVILSLVIGVSLTPLSLQVDNARRNQTQQLLDEVKVAILGFVMANGRLPCPDIDGDGAEDRRSITGVCIDPDTDIQQLYGELPGTTLGVKSVDAWLRPLRYQVAGEFADDAVVANTCDAGVTPTHSVSISLCSADDATIAVGNNGDSSCNSGTTATVNVPVVIFSQGMQTNPGSSDELENLDNSNSLFVSRDYSSNTETGCEFDDLLVYMSSFSIIEALTRVNKLP